MAVSIESIPSKQSSLGPQQPPWAGKRFATGVVHLVKAKVENELHTSNNTNKEDFFDKILSE